MNAIYTYMMRVIELRDSQLVWELKRWPAVICSCADRWCFNCLVCNADVNVYKHALMMTAA